VIGVSIITGVISLFLFAMLHEPLNLIAFVVFIMSIASICLGIVAFLLSIVMMMIVSILID
jgi:hypothetical protein